MDEYSWFIARVRIGSEENVRQRCLDYVKLSADNMIRDCYVFRYEEQRRIRGEWIVQKKILFPGYVFIAVELTGNAKKERLSDTVKTELMPGDMKPEKLKKIEQAIRGIKGVIELLKRDEKPAVLNKEEVQLLRLFGDCEQRVGVSEGVIEQSKIKVYSGPLAGKEKYIRKIDRHKRKASLEIQIFGETKRVQVGLEIVSRN